MKLKSWVCPDSGVEFDLSHLENIIIPYTVKLSKDSEPETFYVNVFFSQHCYSKTVDEESAAHFKEVRRGGEIEYRAFSRERWEFSQKLPEILKGLGDKTCFLANDKEVLYRLEGSSAANRKHGWYICLRLNYRSSRNIPIELSVRSIHYRTNQPGNIRSVSPPRFRNVLQKLINSKS